MHPLNRTRFIQQTRGLMAFILLVLGLLCAEAAAEGGSLSDYFERYDRLSMEFFSLQQGVPHFDDASLRIYVRAKENTNAAQFSLYFDGVAPGGTFSIDIPARHLERGSYYPIRELSISAIQDLNVSVGISYSSETRYGRSEPINVTGLHKYTTDQGVILAIEIYDTSNATPIISAQIWGATPHRPLRARLATLFRKGQGKFIVNNYDDIENRPDFLRATELCRDEGIWPALNWFINTSINETLTGNKYWKSFIDCALAARARQVGFFALSQWSKTAAHSPDSPDLLNAVFRLAEIDIFRGNVSSALLLIDYHFNGTSIPALSSTYSIDIYTRLLLMNGNHKEAIRILQYGPHMDMSRYWRVDNEKLMTFKVLQVNLALALLADNQIDQGRAMLDFVGRSSANGSAMRALKDKANIILGWHLIDGAYGPEAAAVFDRVFLDGPFSGQALIGRGWATSIADKGSVERAPIDGLKFTGLNANSAYSLLRQGLISCHEVRQAFGKIAGICFGEKINFPRAERSSTLENALSRALQYWDNLTRGDPLQLETFEGWILASDAHHALGKHQEARNILESMLKAVTRTKSRLEAAKTFAANKHADDIFWHLTTNTTLVEPDAIVSDLAYFLRSWAASNQTAEIAATMKHLHAMEEIIINKEPGRRDKLSSDDYKIGGSPASMVRKNILIGRGILERNILRTLENKEKRLNEYEAAALFKLARIYE